MSKVAEAAEAFAENIINEGDAEVDAADDVQEGEDNGNGSSTLDERKAKLEQLRKRMVCQSNHSFRTLSSQKAFIALLSSSQSCRSGSREYKGKDHRARGSANGTAAQARRDATPES